MAGEDPLYIARRMVRFASEDVGNADPRALSLAVNAMESYRFLGSPEGELALAQAAIYLATAPKSNAVYQAYNAVRAVIRETGTLPVPEYLRNAPTKLMRELGYAEGYLYPHDSPQAIVDQGYFPLTLQGKGYRFYRPPERGYEKVIAERMAYWQQWRKKEGGKKG